jgi:hypothetical protein
VVVRDERGKVILSAWKPIRHVASLEEAEAEACMHGLRLVIEWVQKPVCVKVDLLEIELCNNICCNSP